jgi:hypothetical protein
MEFSQTKQHDVQERPLHRGTRHVIGERACARVRVRACVHACVLSVRTRQRLSSSTQTGARRANHQA